MPPDCRRLNSLLVAVAAVAIALLFGIPAALALERVFFANTDSIGPVSTTSTAIIAARRAMARVNRLLHGRAQAAAG